jgi:Fur family ferric uptake transcriptional regulator/Fur family zinc uptake transcriptional regulator
MQLSCKKNEAGDVLRAAGLRRTQARQAVLAALVATRRPMAHQRVAELVGLEMIDKVTIYRTLATLRAVGLVHVVRGVDGSTLYCANGDGEGCPGGHPHFQCLECGEMRCIHGQQLPHLSFGEPVVVKSKQFVAFGLCEVCAQKTGEKAAGKHGKPRDVAR